ncbi:MAG TPA: hypothetical protein VGW40_08560 [Allosphingosinicella sp.]|nr:hypothetical protein [Allosphingosinicella sp.]
MARWPDLAALAAILAATPAGLYARTPIDPAALAQGALACRGIPDEVAAAERRIVELGWPRTRRGEGGPVLAFERDGLLLVLVPPDGQGHTLSCGVLARVRRSVSEADIVAAVSAAFGRQPRPGNAGGFPVWELDGGQVAAVSFDGEGGVLFNFWYPRARAR